MKRKVISLMLCAAMTAAVFAGCGKQAVTSGGEKESEAQTNAAETAQLSEEELQAAWEKEPAYGTTIKVGYNGGACLGGFGIAQAKGFFEEEGLKTEIVNMSSCAEAVGTGKVDVGGDHIATLTVPAVNGVGMTFLTASQTGCKSLYVLADSGIESTKDLIGKTVAIPEGIGSSDQNIVMRYLNHDNIDPNDVKYKVVSTDAVIEAMKNGEVQAVNMSDQFARPFVKDGTLKVIRSITYDEDFKKEPCCIMAVNTEFMEKNPITSKKLASAFSKACDWIEDNKKEAAQILIDNSWASGDVETVESFLNEWNFKITDEECETALTSILDDYKSFGLIDSNLDTEKTLNKIWNPVLLDK